MIEVTKKVVLLYSEDGQDETIWRYLCMHAFVCIIRISLYLLYKLGTLLWNYSLPLTLMCMHTLSHLNVHTCTKWEHRGWCPWGRRRSMHIWWSLSQTRPPGSEPDLCCWRPGGHGRPRVSTKIIKFNPSPYFIPRNIKLLYKPLDASVICGMDKFLHIPVVNHRETLQHATILIGNKIHWQISYVYGQSDNSQKAQKARTEQDEVDWCIANNDQQAHNYFHTILIHYCKALQHASVQLYVGTGGTIGNVGDGLFEHYSK